MSTPPCRLKPSSHSECHRLPYFLPHSQRRRRQLLPVVLSLLEKVVECPEPPEELVEPAIQALDLR
jgi:hypothetical protein